MALLSLIENYKSLRKAPGWKLLASDSGPECVALLQTLLWENERTLPASVFLERLSKSWTEASSETLSRDEVRALANRWVKEGWLVCRLHAGEKEESYELTAAGEDAIRAITAFRRNRTGPTESRLELITHAVERLASDSDPDVAVRVALLEAEKRAIDERIKAIRAGKSPAITNAAARDRTEEILELCADLQRDFRHVRENFEALNRDFRAEILQSEGSRGEVLGAFFKGYDAIGESDAGKAFRAFYRLLTDQSARASLADALERIAGREFFSTLDRDERRRLVNLPDILFEGAQETNHVMHALARSLREFVQSRSFIEERRITKLLREARNAAHELRDVASRRDALLEQFLTSAQISSVSQLELDDPEDARMESSGIRMAGAPGVNLEALLEQIAEADIDYPALMRAVEAALAKAEAEGRDRATVGDVLRALPVIAKPQGLGSIVGLLSLAVRFGETASPLEPAAAITPQPQTAEPASNEATAAAGEADESADEAADPAEPMAPTPPPLPPHWSPAPGGRDADPNYIVPLPAEYPQERLEWKDRLGEACSGEIPLCWFTPKSLEGMRRDYRWR